MGMPVHGYYWVSSLFLMFELDSNGWATDSGGGSGATSHLYLSDKLPDC